MALLKKIFSSGAKDLVDSVGNNIIEVDIVECIDSTKRKGFNDSQVTKYKQNNGNKRRFSFSIEQMFFSKYEKIDTNFTFSCFEKLIHKEKV